MGKRRRKAAGKESFDAKTRGCRIRGQETKSSWIIHAKRYICCMLLSKILATSVGPAIAKGIVKIWLKDKEILASVSESLIGLIEKKTDDAFTRKKAERQFQEIGDKVAQSLLPVFESDGETLKENQKDAVAFAVAQTLENTPISATFLLDRKLDPTKLSKFLIDSRPRATVGFSQLETELYRRIIVEASSYIVDVASQLPAFTEKSFAEIIKNGDQLIDTTNRILEEVRRIRAGTDQDNLNQNAARFETDYRLTVGRRLDELELFGVDFASSTNRRHRLSVAYVTLSVCPRVGKTDILQRESEEAKTDGLPDDPEDGENLVSVDRALKKSKRLLIRGQAGSGKTTLLQWVAVKASARTFEEPLEEWNSLVPFFIRLRDCVEKGLPKPEEFPGLIAPSIAALAPIGWVHEKLKSGKAILLIDGVDEMREAQRGDVRTWIKELSNSFPQIRIIVSSRPTAIEEGWMDGAEFDDAELQPMAVADIVAFVDHWHLAVQEQLQDGSEISELGVMQENLKKVIRTNPPLRSLATSPLLCAMLCALNRDRRQNLPSDRIELYDACCHMLAERRDKERRVTALQDYPQLSYRQKKPILEDLAYWYMTNGWSVVERSRAQDRISKRLENMPGLPSDITGEAVMDLFVDRTGLLREPRPDHIDFTHRTFQEFLAAKAALDEGNVGVLIKSAHEDLWRETIVLAAGLASQKICQELIMGLIKKGDEDPRKRHTLHLLAVSCLETSVALDASVIKEVKARLAELVPPNSAGEAWGLRSAGDLAVPYLGYRPRLYATQASACVRALSLIGTDAAFEAICGYSVDERVTVTNALLKAWEVFDRTEFARRVFASRRYLYIGRIASLEGFRCLGALKTLALWDTGPINDLSELALMPSLKHLILRYCTYIQSFTSLAKLNSLEELNLSYLRYSPVNLNPLANLPNLKRITIHPVPVSVQVIVPDSLKEKVFITKV